MSEAARQRKIVTHFKLRGLTLQKDAAQSLLRALESVPEWERALHSILDVVCSSQATKSIVDAEAIGQAIQSLSKKVVKTHSCKDIDVLNTFQLPKFKFDIGRKSFVVDDSPRSFFADPALKAEYLCQRYQLLYQRTLRNKMFAPPSVNTPANLKQSYFPITPVESLLGDSGLKCIFGMLTQLQEGQYYIEDPNAVVPIDLSQAKPTAGYFTENCMVLAEGKYHDGMFHVGVLGSPPPESRDASKSALMMGSDFFGSGITAKESVALEQAEIQSENSFVILLSDVWLDQPKVLDKLRKLFSGYESLDVSMFIFMGNFSSNPPVGDEIFQYRDRFDELANIISSFPRLCEKTQFVFIPGPGDPGLSNIIPRAPFTKQVTGKLTEKVPNCILAHNPCRIRFFNREIVIFREDLLSKLRRNCIIPPNNSETSDHCEQLIKTIIDQAHLCPLPQHARPTYWAFDHTLHLFPAPHIVVLGDKCDQYVRNYEETLCLNPGQFPVDFSFTVLAPIRQEVEFCRIDDD